MSGFDEVENGFSEVLKGGIITGVQTVFLHQLPEAFDQIELRRIRREKQQFDIQVLRGVLNQVTALIARVVQNDRDGHGQVLCRQSVQQPADMLAVDVGIRGDGDEFMGHGVQRP